MIFCKVSNESRPKDGNTAVPSFSFKVELEKDSAHLPGEFEYILFDKAPENTGSHILPDGAAQIGSGTIRSGDTLTLPPEQTAVIIGFPVGTYCTVTEGMGAGWTSDRVNQLDTISKSINQTGYTGVYSFKNNYEAAGPITITGTKRLAGREQRAGEFSFKLTDNNRYDDYGNDNNTYEEVIAMVKTGESRGMVTGADGTKTGLAMFTFKPQYCGSNTYELHEYGGTKILRYKVSELIPAGAQANADGSVTCDGVTYETHTQDVTVTIRDNGDGTLKVTSNPLVFTNEFHAETAVTLTARKELAGELNGRTLQAGEFSFTLRRSAAATNSQPLATGTNDADGNIVFSPAVRLTERDMPGVTFLISEVQGTDPTVTYLSSPVSLSVKTAMNPDGSIVAALPGQEIVYGEENCPVCGGSGGMSGLIAVLTDSNDGSFIGEVSLEPYFNDTYLDICPDCRGTGYDPNNPGADCSRCSGAGIGFPACTHANQTGENCPDCITQLGGKKAIHLADGRVLMPVGDAYTPDDLTTAGIDISQLPSSVSCKISTAYVYTEDEWNSVVTSGNWDYSQPIALIYMTESDGHCPTCSGSGKVQGKEAHVSGNAVLPVLTNHIKSADPGPGPGPGPDPGPGPKPGPWQIKYTLSLDGEAGNSDLNVVYDGMPHRLSVNVSLPENGASVSFGTAPGVYDMAESPEITDAGELTVYFRITAASYEDATGEAKLTVRKADIPEEDITAPVAKELSYTGMAQELVTAGSVSSGLGAMVYAVTADETAPAETSYTEALPTGTEAGSYYVWYKVTGDKNHNDSTERYVVSIISTAQDDEGICWISEEDLKDYKTPELKSLTLSSDEIKIGPKKDRRTVRVSVSMDYMDAVTYTGKVITPKNDPELQFRLDAGEILSAAGVSGVKAEEIFKISYKGGSKNAGAAAFYAKISLVPKAKSRFSLTKQQLKDLKKIIGVVNKMLRKKSNRISITINKASIASLRPIEVRAKLDKNGRIRYKGDKLKKLKSVKAMLNPADTKLKKLSSSAYRIMVVDPEENKVRVIGAGKNYTGYVTVTVSK